MEEKFRCTQLMQPYALQQKRCKFSCSVQEPWKACQEDLKAAIAVEIVFLEFMYSSLNINLPKGNGSVLSTLCASELNDVCMLAFC